jgi:cardiolipin synthase
MRSFSLDLEISVMVRGEEFLSQLRAIEDANRAMSRELTLEEWLARPLRVRVLDNLARLTAAVQ